MSVCIYLFIVFFCVCKNLNIFQDHIKYKLYVTVDCAVCERSQNKFMEMLEKSSGHLEAFYIIINL